MWRESERLYATLLGCFTCALVAPTFLVPWYGIDSFWQGDFSHRYEYSLGFDEYHLLEDMSYLMSGLTVVLLMSLTASINAAILPLLGRTESGAIVSAMSAELLVASAIIFYIGTMQAGPLDHFFGTTQLDRSVSVDAAPMVGFWILIGAILFQWSHVGVLTYLSRKKRKGEDPLNSLEKRP